jgi:hypothetical protein
MINRHRKLLFECYLTGQMSARQWQEHLAEDAGLAAFADAHVPSVIESVEKAFERATGAPLPDISMRDKALAQYLERHPTHDDYDQHVLEIGFRAGWNAHKQRTYENLLGIKR